MVVLIDNQGQEQSIDTYRSRLVIPAHLQVTIRDFVKGLEDALNAAVSIAGNGLRQHPENFPVLMREFLTWATYSQTLLDTPYKPSDVTLQQMYYFWDDFLSFNRHSHGRLNESMYDLEKMVRLGIVPKLEAEGKTDIFKPNELREILSLEDEYYARGREYYEMKTEELKHHFPGDWFGLLIKFLGRHPALGIPIDSERRNTLERILWVHPNLLYDDWLGCAAKRAGFQLPPISSYRIDVEIETWVEQKPDLVEREFAQRNYPEAKRQEILLCNYISTMHHLRRLLSPNAS